ncbi:MAG: tRNA (N6-isopentenyl adenosine(37)-C2)-methylthiotransferase MiaB [bacterium]
MLEDQNPYANNGDENAMPTTGRPGKRVFIETYGCQMNLADSELMGGILAQEGYTAATSLEESDIILINTCAVREKAEERVFGRLTHLLRFKNENPELVLGVTGCMANHLKKDIVERAPYVDIVAGPDAYRRLPTMLVDAQREESDPLIDVRLDKQETYDGLMPQRSPGITAWISVQRGCDKFCTFCVVPFTRGRERGVSPEDVIRQCRDVAERGYKEVTLLGQTVNSYRWGDDYDFSDLLEDIVPIDGIERIRFTSPYPTDFNPKLIETMAKHDKICNYLHLPAQSGSTSMLNRMKRLYSRGEFDELVGRIRETIPDIAMSTDIIVGFSGETDEEFEETLDLMRKTRFDFAYMFRYSERSLTAAARNQPDDVPDAVKGERLKRLIEVQEEISGEVFRTRIGTRQRVMVIGEARRNDEQLCGRTDDFKMAVFPKADGIGPGDLVDVRVVDATSHTLICELA